MAETELTPEERIERLEKVKKLYDEELRALKVEQAKTARTLAKRGPKFSEARELCEWMFTFCITRVADNGMIFIELSEECGEHAGRYPEEMMALGEKHLTTALINMRIAAGQKQPEPEVIAKAIKMYVQRTRGDALKIKVAHYVGHTYENGEHVIYVDRLADAIGPRYIRISKYGWTLSETSGDLVFLSEFKAKALPRPLEGAFGFEDLPLVLDMTRRDMQIGFLFQLSTLVLEKNFVNLYLYGETRSGKTVRSIYLRSVLQLREIFDNEVKKPMDYREAILHGAGTHIVHYDNLSVVDTEMSDTLCQFSTEATLPKRALFENSLMLYLTTRNPLLMTGIEIALPKSDLINRTLFMYVPSRPPNTSKTPKLLEEEFSALHPLWLGVLCNAAVGVLANIDEVRQTERGNMAAFECMAIAAGIELGWSEQEISELIQDYSRRDAKGRLVLPPLLELVRLLVEDYTEGTYEYQDFATKLLRDLRVVAEANDIPVKHIPSDAEHCSRLLNEGLPMLMTHGIWLSTGEHTKYGNVTYIQKMMTPSQRAEANSNRLAAHMRAANGE